VRPEGLEPPTCGFEGNPDRRRNAAHPEDDRGGSEAARYTAWMHRDVFWYGTELGVTLMQQMRQYTAVIERDSDTGLYVGYVPGMPGAHSQAESLDELNANLREVVAMLLEDGDQVMEAEFVGIQTVRVA
jgi:predicted RNase H-like HicB family nuclease